MSRVDVVDEIAAQMQDVPRTRVEQIVKAFEGAIVRTLSDGGEVRMNGFGTFRVSERGARPGRNPQTGEPMQIRASRNVRFAAARGIKDLLTGGGKSSKAGGAKSGRGKAAGAKAAGAKATDSKASGARAAAAASKSNGSATGKGATAKGATGKGATAKGAAAKGGAAAAKSGGAKGGPGKGAAAKSGAATPGRAGKGGSRK